MKFEKDPCVYSKHQANDTYYDGGTCSTPYCSWSEFRCKICGWFVVNCGCHFMYSVGRIPEKRYGKKLYK
jgi:hypothetical protein